MSETQREVWRRAAKKYRERHAKKVKFMVNAWRARNKRHKKEYDAKYYQDNRERCLAWASGWKVKNPEEVRKHARDSAKRNPARVIETSRIRSHSLKQAIPNWYEKELVEELYRKRDELNRKWNREGADCFVVDHVIPLNPIDQSVCGLHCFANLQLLTRRENNIKKDNYIAEWR